MSDSYTPEEEKAIKAFLKRKKITRVKTRTVDEYLATPFVEPESKLRFSFGRSRNKSLAKRLRTR